LDVPYDVSARTASLDVVKLLLHSTISDNKKWFTTDIKDFYLGTLLPDTRYEYVRIERKKLPPAYIAAHNLEFLFHNDAVYFQIRKCMYGLPQAGRLSQLRLISHLAKRGYHQSPNTSVPVPTRDPGRYVLLGGRRLRRSIRQPIRR
jgi:hypothetical protein